MKIKKQFSEAVQLVKKSAAAAADAGAKFDDTLTSILEHWHLNRYIVTDTTIRWN